MATYKSTPRRINRDAEAVYARLSNVGSLQQYLDNLPADVMAKVGNVKFTDDAIVINAAPVGEIVLSKGACVEPTLVTFTAGNSPVPMGINIDITPQGDACDVTTRLEVEVPKMLAGFVGPKMQEAADRMADLLQSLL